MASSFLTQLNETNFVAYDDKFHKIIEINPKLEVLATANYKFAHEAGVYIAARNEVLFTSNRLGNTSTADQYTEINKINLSTKKVSTVKPSSPILLANGGTFHNGKVILCAQGQRDIGGSIVSMDP
ncbi:16458_t:CDS:1, partial [Acaulospora morrowiae]